MASEQRLRSPAVVVLVALALLLVACGGNSESRPSTMGEEGGGVPSKAFITKGPNGDLAKVGKESTVEEREQASRVIAESLRYREIEDWSGQCETFSARFAEQVAEGAPQGGFKTCAASIKAFAAGTKQSILNSTMTEPLAALRVNGVQAFAFYHGKAAKNYVIEMERSGGEWKVSALSELEL